jgi:hypothetical protein
VEVARDIDGKAMFGSDGKTILIRRQNYFEPIKVSLTFAFLFVPIVALGLHKFKHRNAVLYALVEIGGSARVAVVSRQAGVARHPLTGCM